MTKNMPQEIEVWYLLPALRKELSKTFINDYKLTQKESAEILGLTESAVSQYLSSKRAKELEFSRNEVSLIKKTAKKIIKDRNNATKYLYDISIAFHGSKTLCDCHRKHDSSISKNCSICVS